MLHKDVLQQIGLERRLNQYNSKAKFVPFQLSDRNCRCRQGPEVGICASDDLFHSVYTDSFLKQFLTFCRSRALHIFVRSSYMVCLDISLHLGFAIHVCCISYLAFFLPLCLACVSLLKPLLPELVSKVDISTA